MKHRFVTPAVIFLTAFAFSSSDAFAAKPQAATTKPTRAFLWHVKDAKGKSVATLVGSVHLAKKEVYPLPGVFYSTFDAADRLVLEVDITKIDQAALQQLMLKGGMYAPPDGLSKHVSNETLDALKTYGKIPLEAAERMKPWLLITTITLLEAQGAGMDPSLGVDQHFMQRATKAKKKIEQLESAIAQIELMASFDGVLQDKYLKSTLDEVTDMQKMIDEMIAAWMAGDAKAIEKLVYEDTVKRQPELKPVMVKMFDERNVVMADKIDAMIKEGHRPYVVVGAGHLVGEKGLVKLMSTKGYKIEQATVAPATTRPTAKPAKPAAKAAR